MSSVHRIDVHQHVVPPFYAQALARNLAGRRRWLQYWRPHVPEGAWLPGMIFITRLLHGV
jgi:hypothetical protein